MKSYSGSKPTISRVRIFSSHKQRRKNTEERNCRQTTMFCARVCAVCVLFVRVTFSWCIKNVRISILGTTDLFLYTIYLSQCPYLANLYTTLFQ